MKNFRRTVTSVFFGVIFTGLLYGIFSSFGDLALLENATGIWSMFPVPLVPLLVALATGLGVRGTFRRDVLLASGLILSAAGASCIAICSVGYLMGLPSEPWLVSFLVSLIGFGAIMFESIRKEGINFRTTIMTSWLIILACLIFGSICIFLFPSLPITSFPASLTVTFAIIALIDCVVMVFPYQIREEGKRRGPIWIKGMTIMAAGTIGLIVCGILSDIMVYYPHFAMELSVLVILVGSMIASSKDMATGKGAIARIMLLVGFPLFLIGVLCETFEDLADYLGIYGMPSVVVAIVGFIIFFCGAGVVETPEKSQNNPPPSSLRVT